MVSPSPHTVGLLWGRYDLVRHLEHGGCSVIQFLILKPFSLNTETKCKNGCFFPSTFKLSEVFLHKTGALSLVLRPGWGSWRENHTWALSHSSPGPSPVCSLQVIGCSQLTLLWLADTLAMPVFNITRASESGLDTSLLEI